MKTLNEVISKHPHILKVMEEAAVVAGNDIMDVYVKDEIDTDWKGDDSPLTLADLRAHKVISERLMHSFPDIQLISEEDDTGAEITVGDVFFLVDPLDGTKEFIKRTGEFTVNIALVIQGITKLGVVYLPAEDTLYATTQYDGAVRIRSASKPNDEREFHNISVRSVPEAGPTLVMSASHSSDETRDYCALYSPMDTLSAGSSLKVCKVAEGSADFYPRLGRTMEWDIAASHAVLKAAGGNVVSLRDAAEIKYGKSGLDNGYFIAAASVSDVITADIDWR